MSNLYELELSLRYAKVNYARTRSSLDFHVTEANRHLREIWRLVNRTNEDAADVKACEERLAVAQET
jgi:hypothetical protein